MSEPLLLRDRPLVYVAGYYSANPMHGTANAASVFDPLVEAGWVPVVPHVSCVLDLLCPHDPAFWYDYDLAILDACAAMYVCGDPLTAVSTGVSDEEIYAVEGGIPIMYGVIKTPEEVLG